MSVHYEEIPVRALIRFGDLSVGTPFINSIGVSRKRGSMCATFQVSLRVHIGDVSAIQNTGVGGDIIKIYAGSSSGRPSTGLPRIFTGFVLNFSIQPDFTNADYVTVNMSGKDLLSLLEGQKVTRRAKVTEMERWGIINAVLKPNKKYQSRDQGKVSSSDHYATYDQYLDTANLHTHPSSIDITRAEHVDRGDASPALSTQNRGSADDQGKSDGTSNGGG